MWPRDTGGLPNSVNGFVCFQQRSAAEKAVHHCRVHLCFGGRQLRISWGKAILQSPNPGRKPDTERDAPTRNPRDSLSEQELEEFREVLDRNLLAPSRKSICNAMAFCFEKSRAARHICDLLQELMLRECPVETTIAQLYLLSDILYNSQQPGIRNAFLYRDTLERMCPTIFSHWRRLPLGRLGRDRLSTAVSSVLSAWTRWGVYDSAFLDKLDEAYTGRVLAACKPKVTSSNHLGHNETNDSPPQPQGKSHLAVDAGNTERPSRGTIRATEQNPEISQPTDVPDDIDGLPLEDGDYIDDDNLTENGSLANFNQKNIDVDSTNLNRNDDGHEQAKRVGCFEEIPDEDLDGEPLDEEQL